VQASANCPGQTPPCGPPQVAGSYVIYVGAAPLGLEYLAAPMFRSVLIERRYGVFARLARSLGCFPPPDTIHMGSDFTGIGVRRNGSKIASRQYGAVIAFHWSYTSQAEREVILATPVGGQHSVSV
jgi:hypothetical protein